MLKSDRVIYLSKTAIALLESRYLLKDEKGKIIETPEQMFRRVARFIAKAESKEKRKEYEEKFFDALCKLEFLPNTPTLINAGKKDAQLSACFLLDIEDSLESIMSTLKDASFIFKSGGGVGFNFSKLRPAGSIIKSTGGESDGPVSFMYAYNGMCEAVKEGGVRRGAMMALLSVEHPDIERFITCKNDEKSFNNFNISVLLTEAFMKAVKKNSDYWLKFDGKRVRKLKARNVWNSIVEGAWLNGEPGIIFQKNLEKGNTLKALGKLDGVNPCGEVPLFSYESCNLASINLTKFVEEKTINYDRLKEMAKLVTRFLDNVIDMNTYPLEKIDEKTKANRKIGLGVMGFADMLIMLDVSYNSKNAVKIADKVMRCINETSIEASEELAEERGTFPNYKQSVFHNKKIPQRNATTTVCAPTGSISIIANCSSGIEPNFDYKIKRRILGEKEFTEIHPLYVESGDKNILIISEDVPWEQHVKIQATFQKHISNAVSKTINMPFDATKGDVGNAYLLAYKTGCKSITVYRDGSRLLQTLTKDGGNKVGVRSERPAEELTAKRTRKKVGCGATIFMTKAFNGGGGVHDFKCEIGKSGGCLSSFTDGLSRVISIGLQYGVPVKEITEQLENIRCSEPLIISPKEKYLSCCDVIAKKLKEENGDTEQNGEGYCPECPSCSGKLVFKNGCVECLNCFFKKCG